MKQVPNLVYLDNAAATPLDPRVEKAMLPFWSKYYYNPSALYEPARETRQALETARGRVAKVLGAKPTEVIFTAGATESINLALYGVAKLDSNKKVIISAIEHDAVRNSALAAFGKTNVIVCPVLPSGIVNLDALKKMINKDVSLISIMYANNETGTIQPLTKIAHIIRNVKTPIAFHSDAAQAGNYLDLHVNRLGVDLLTLNGSKLYGPKQSGCLYVKSGVELAPFIHGGGQERGLRSGTENVPGSIGFAQALEFAHSMRKRETSRTLKLRDEFLHKLRQSIPDTRLNGDAKSRLPNNVNISFPNVNGEMLVHYLDAAGILAATGSACSANKDEPSHVLAAIGLTEPQINSSLRISLGRSTTRAQLNYLLKHLQLIIPKLQRLAH